MELPRVGSGCAHFESNWDVVVCRIPYYRIEREVVDRKRSDDDIVEIFG